MKLNYKYYEVTCPTEDTVITENLSEAMSYFHNYTGNVVLYDTDGEEFHILKQKQHE